MGQKFKEDVIGTLSHSSNIVTLAPSQLTIGGQQYKTGTINLNLPSLTLSSLYMLYVVIVGGVPTLITSTNVNSIGPVGYTSWKLVGAYVTNLASAFGQFLEIDTTSPTFEYTVGKTAVFTFANNVYQYVENWATSTTVVPYYNPVNGVHQLPITGIYNIYGRISFGGITGTSNTISSNVYSIICVRNTLTAAPNPTGSNNTGDLNNPWYVSHEPVCYIGGNLVQCNQGDYVWWAIASNLFTNNARIIGANLTIKLESIAKPIRDM